MERLVSEFEMGVSGDAARQLSRQNSSGVLGEMAALRLSQAASLAYIEATSTSLACRVRNH